MQDGIINETGDSRYLRTVAAIRQLAPTYDAFLELLVKGELPVDLNGINPDGWAQLGTALNKANLLTDATAALASLGPEATPDQMFAALANLVKDAKNRLTYGTSDLVAGTSNLADGVFYFKYE